MRSAEADYKQESEEKNLESTNNKKKERRRILTNSLKKVRKDFF